MTLTVISTNLGTLTINWVLCGCPPEKTRVFKSSMLVQMLNKFFKLLLQLYNSHTFPGFLSDTWILAKHMYTQWIQIKIWMPMSVDPLRRGWLVDFHIYKVGLLLWFTLIYIYLRHIQQVHDSSFSSFLLVRDVCHPNWKQPKRLALLVSSCLISWISDISQGPSRSAVALSLQSRSARWPANSEKNVGLLELSKYLKYSDTGW